MMKEKKIVAVIGGGNSSEEVISFKSSRQVYECLDRELFEPYLVLMKGRDWTVHFENGETTPVDLNTFGFRAADREIRFDYALIMIHGTPGENGYMQGYFEMMGVPYSACSVECSAVTFNKSLCKKLLAGCEHIHLAREILIKGDSELPDSDTIVEELGLPLFVKPNASGSSFGVTKVKNRDQILPAIEQALAESESVLLEQFIDGREVSCGMMVIDQKEWILPVTELITDKEFFDFEAKYTDGVTREVTPAQMSDEVIGKLNRATAQAYHILGCRGVVRIDFIVDPSGTPYFIEANTTPGMSANSIVPQQWREAGLSMTKAFTMVINETLK